MSWYELYNGKAHVVPGCDAMEAAVMSVLKTYTDAQFCGWLAMTLENQGGTLASYIAQRLDKIGLLVEAMEAVEL